MRKEGMGEVRVGGLGGLKRFDARGQGHHYTMTCSPPFGSPATFHCFLPQIFKMKKLLNIDI